MVSAWKRRRRLEGLAASDEYEARKQAIGDEMIATAETVLPACAITSSIAPTPAR